MRPIGRVGAATLTVIAIAAPSHAGASPSNVAALQAALEALQLYRGHVDGIRGPLTRRAVVAFQRRRGLRVDGIAGSQRRRALGWRGTPGLGSRAMRFGNRGWDVAALQFLLQRAGRGPGRADGHLVVIQHRLGFTSWYAHLARITSWVGERVVGGTRIGYVGSTGYSTGPHLHFEVRRYNTPIDPVTRLLATAATARSRGARRHSGECGDLRRDRRKPPRGSDWIARERLC